MKEKEEEVCICNHPKKYHMPLFNHLSSYIEQKGENPLIGRCCVISVSPSTGQCTCSEYVENFKTTIMLLNSLDPPEVK